jgi:multidrug efflux pump
MTREITVGAPATQWWIQLSTAIVFGLGFATLLTLIVTPAALMIIEQMREKRIRFTWAAVTRFARTT